MKRPAVLCLLLCCVLGPAAAADPTATLKAGFGGAAVDAIARLDYRLRLSGADGERVAEYALLPHSQRLHVRTADGAQVWSGPDGSWRLQYGQWAFLGDAAARPHRSHVAHHFLSLALDPATSIEPVAAHHLRITPAGQPAFDVRLDPATGRIAENHFPGGAVVRELDYREVGGGLWWPMRFEVVQDGKVTRAGDFEQVHVRAEATLPPMPVASAASSLVEPGLVEPGSGDDAALLLGAGWLSGVRNDYNLSLDAAGDTMVFARSDAGFDGAGIWIAHREGARWSEPTRVPFSDARYRDSDPWLSPDGRTLYFISDRPAHGRAHREDTDLWRVRLDGQRFGTPEHLPRLASEGEELGPELHDGWLYFNSTRAGGPAAMAIYRARVAGDGFARPEPLPAPFNDGRLQGDFTLSPDGRVALFWSQRGDTRELDLFASRRTDAGWATPVRLPAPFNAPGLDFTPAFSADGDRLYFASLRKPGWLDDPAHLLNGQANLYVAPVAALDKALDAATAR